MTASTNSPALGNLLLDGLDDQSTTYQTLVLEKGEVFEWVEISVEFHDLSINLFATVGASFGIPHLLDVLG